MSYRDGRKYDLQQLNKEYKNANSDNRHRIDLTARKIVNESGKIRSMREELIKAHRQGNKDRIAGIHSYVEDHKEYR